MRRLKRFAQTWLLAAGLVALPSAAFANNGCPSGLEHFLGQIFCNFLTTLSDTLDPILNSMYGKMAQLSTSLASLFVLIYGIQVIVGISTFNVREAGGRAVKLAIAVSLMTGASTFDMGTVYLFFNSLALEVPALFIHILPNDAGLTLSSGNLVESLYASIDKLFYQYITGELELSANKFKILGFLGALALFCPPLFGLVAGWIFQAFMLLVRSLVTILMALATIMFLVSLGPLFCAFLLFETTSSLFWSWVRHLTSNALQVTFVLAGLVMWMSLMAGYAKPISDFNNMIEEYKAINVAAGAQAGPQDGWGMCELELDLSTSGPQIGGCAGDPVAAGAQVFEPEFMYFFVYYVIALLVLTHGFSALLDYAPTIAQSLAGAGTGGNPLSGTGLDAFSKVTAADKRQDLGDKKGEAEERNRPGDRNDGTGQQVQQSATNALKDTLRGFIKPKT